MSGVVPASPSPTEASAIEIAGFGVTKLSGGSVGYGEVAMLPTASAELTR